MCDAKLIVKSAIKHLLIFALLFRPASGWCELMHPFITARTDLTGKNEVQRKGADYVETQTVRSISVYVEYRFLQKPTAEYEAQCFFVAKNESSKQWYIYETHAARFSDMYGTLRFKAQPLLGSGQRVTSIPFTGTTWSGQPVKGRLHSSTSFTGSKVAGWVVRIVIDGQVLNIESNQFSLKQLAKDNPDTFKDALNK